MLSDLHSTKTVLRVLAECSVLFMAATVLGMAIQGGVPAALLGAEHRLPETIFSILWVWLMTCMLHYLMRNVQAREAAFAQQKSWLELLSDIPSPLDAPGDQRQVVLGAVRRLTRAQPQLWLSRLWDGQLSNGCGEQPGALARECVGSGRPCVTLRQPCVRSSGALKTALAHYVPEPSIGDLRVLSESSSMVGAVAQMVVPIARLEDQQEIMGVLELNYFAPEPSYLQLL